MLLTTLLILSLFVCLGSVAFLGLRNWFQPAIMFLLSAVVDVFFPALYWMHVGQVNNPDWVPLLNVDQINTAIIFYIPFLAIFIAALLAFDRHAVPQPEVKVDLKAVESRLLLITGFMLFLTLLKLVVDVVDRGGIEEWFWSRFIFSTVNEDGADHGFLVALPARDMFQALMGLGFFYRHQFKRHRLFGVVFPAVAMVLAMLTFLRGSVLTCSITLIFAEIMRRRHGRTEADSVPAIHPKALLISGLIVFMGIYGYGSIRDGFRGAAAGGVEDSESVAAPTFLTAGHGLLGLSHILANYGHGVAYLNGKTYIDMALLPVPRFIYTSKPDWYGIDDITRGMGWPDTTQSAVTMPGEAYANFGLWGLLMAIPLGMMLGVMNRVATTNLITTLLLGPTLFFQIPAVANWMAFTGIMNSLTLFVLTWIAAMYVHGGDSGARAPHHCEPITGKA